MKITAPLLVLFITAIFLFLAATNIQGGWLYVVDAALWSVLLLALLIPLLQLRHLQIRRYFPSQPLAGADLRVRLVLKNSRRWPRLFIQFGELPVRYLRSGQLCKLEQAEKFTTWLGPGESVELEYRLPESEAGVWIFQGFKVGSFGPLGLMGVYWQQKQLEALVVLPRRPLHGISLFTHELLQNIRQARHRSYFSEDISHFREYQPGDSRRSIHWRNTARQGHLIVAEAREEPFQQALVVVDTHHYSQDRSAFLSCVEAAEKVCHSLLELQMEIFCLAQSADPEFWRPYQLSPPPRQLRAVRQWEDLSYWLATLEMDASVSLGQALTVTPLDLTQLLIVMLCSHLPDTNLLRLVSQGRAESGLPPIVLYTVQPANLPDEFQGQFTQITLSSAA